jgi:hypothetical protein
MTTMIRVKIEDWSDSGIEVTQTAMAPVTLRESDTKDFAVEDGESLELLGTAGKNWVAAVKALDWTQKGITVLGVDYKTSETARTGNSVGAIIVVTPT